MYVQSAINTDIPVSKELMANKLIISFILVQPTLLIMIPH